MEMKGITCCADCVYYSKRKHKCVRCNNVESDARKHFYDDCALEDVMPMVHGHWIHQNGYGDDLYYTCSACGCDWLCIEGTPEENNMRYCPECGARMDGANE